MQKLAYWASHSRTARLWGVGALRCCTGFKTPRGRIALQRLDKLARRLVPIAAATGLGGAVSGRPGQASCPPYRQSLHGSLIPGSSGSTSSLAALLDEIHPRWCLEKADPKQSVGDKAAAAAAVADEATAAASSARPVEQASGKAPDVLP